MPAQRTSRLLAALLGVGLIALVVIGLVSQFGGGGRYHLLRIGFSSAEQIVPGLDVRIAGRKVGQIDSIALHGHAPTVTVEIDEGDVWPLPAGTTAALRWGSTTSLEFRYLELTPGPRSGRTLPDNALISASRTSSAVELDQFYRIFRANTSGDVGTLVQELAQSVGGNGPALHAGLAAAPGGLNASSAVLSQLGGDQRALNQLVSEGDQVTGALASKQDDLSQLTGNLAGTFSEFAQHTADEQASLQQAPATLRTAEVTLNRLDSSLNGLQTLVTDIAPGATQLRQLAPVARDALLRLSGEAPLLTRTLNSGTAAASPLDSLLSTGTSFLPPTSEALDKLAPMVGCMRPYSPELAGMLATWSGWNDNYTTAGHYSRTFDLTVNPALIPGTPLNAAQAVSAFKGALNYAMPRPPGLNAGTPWFQPQCGAGPSSLNAADDPEAGG